MPIYTSGRIGALDLRNLDPPLARVVAHPVKGQIVASLVGAEENWIRKDETVSVSRKQHEEITHL